MNNIPALAAIYDWTPDYLPAGISVWLLELACQSDRLNEWLDLLTDAERQRCLRYRQQADQIRFATTRVTLKHLLAERLHRPFEEIEFEFDAYGKPRLLHRETLFFNVSHSGNFSLIALSEHRPVGIDIEAVAATPRPDFGFPGLTPDECRYCNAHPDTATYFRIWSGKEAVLKAFGVGIATHLPSLSVVPVTPEQYAVSFYSAAPAVEAWQLPAPPFFVAALAAVKNAGGSRAL